MLIFALSTSVGHVSASFTIINNSSYNLKFKISGSDYGQDGNRHDIDEEFTLNIGQSKLIEIEGRNSHTPSTYIYEIFIYNENDEILKRYRNYGDDYESVYSINIGTKWEITDKLFE
jgi:hypothetical protein